MKQTNNALKFLQAQYRAIFKNAFLKGLASAVILSTGLAALAAPAHAAVEWGTDKTVTITDEQPISENKEAKDLIISGSGAELNITLPEQADADLTITVSNSLTINGGSLIASGDSDNSVTIAGDEDSDPKLIPTLTASGGLIDLTYTEMTVGQTDINGTEIKLTNSTLNAASANINAAEINLTSSSLETASANISGSTITLSGSTETDLSTLGFTSESASILTSSTVDLNGFAALQSVGDLTLNDTDITLNGNTVKEGDLPSSAAIASAKGAVKLQSGSTISVADGKVGAVAFNNFTMDGAETKIQVGSGSSLYMAGNGIDDASPVLTINNGLIINDGTLELGANDPDSDNTPIAHTVNVQSGSLTNNGTLNIGVQLPAEEDAEQAGGGQGDGSDGQGDSGQLAALGEDPAPQGTVMTFKGGKLINSQNATINIYEASSLSLLADNSLNNQGTIVLHTANGDSSLTVSANALYSAQEVNSPIPSSDAKIVVADLASLGKVQASGAAAADEVVKAGLGTASIHLKGDDAADSVFQTNSTKFNEQFGINLNATDTQAAAEAEPTPKFVLEANAPYNVFLQFTDDLELNEAKITGNFGAASGSASIGTTGELTYTTDATNGEALNGYALHAGDLIFVQGAAAQASVLAETGVTVSGDSAVVKFQASRSVTTDGSAPLTLQNAKLELGNYTFEEADSVGQIKVDVTLKDTASLALKDNPWQAKDITLSGSNSNLSISNSALDAEYKTGLTAEDVVVNNASASVQVGDNKALGASYLKANNIDIKAGSFNAYNAEISAKTFKTASNGVTATIEGNSSLNVLGDGSGSTVDFNGSGVNLTNSSLNLNKVADTIGLKYTAAAGEQTSGTFTAANGFTQFTSTNGRITVNLDGIEGLNKLSIDEANALLGVFTTGTGLVDIVGSITPSFETSTNESGEQVVSAESLFKSDSDELTINFATETSRNTVLTGLTDNKKISGEWKAVETNGSAVNTTANTVLSLQSSNGNFARDASGNTVAVNVGENSTLQLNNSGAVGTISGSSSATLSLNTGSEVSVKNAEGSQNVNIGKLQSAGVLHAKEVTVNTATLTAGSAINSSSLDIQNSLTATGSQLVVSGDADLGTKAVLEGSTLTTGESGDVTAKTLTLTSGSTLTTGESGSVTADNLTLTGGSSLKTQTITLRNNGTLRVGVDANDELQAGTASVVADKIVLSGGTLFIDPEFTEKTATVFAKTIGQMSGSEMQIDGNIVVGKNSALGLGGDEAAFLENLARYQNNGSLTKDYGAYMYVNTYDINLKGKKLIIAAEDKTKLEGYLTDNSSIYLGTDSAIQISASALNSAVQGNSQIFSNLTASNTITSTDGTLIVPANMSADKFKNLFGTDVTLTAGNKIKVTTENGLYSGVIDSADDLKNGITMTIATNARSILSGLSNPTYEFVMNVMSEESKHYADEDEFNDAIKAENSSNAGAVESRATETSAYGENGIAVIDDSLGYLFLQDALGSLNSSAIEKSARLATFGGSMQALQTANNATVDAVNGRLGMGNSAARLTVADNAQGAGIWVAPVYRNFSSDSFEANGISYGADVDLFGAVLGADFTLSNGLRVGAAFNLGSGDADGNEAGSGVSNDFDYFGLSLYAGLNPMDNLSLSADVSFTQTDNDLTAASGVSDFGNMTASVDATAWSVGLNAQYLIQSTLDIAPHIGMRYTNYDLDNYDVKLDGNTLAHTTGDSASVFSIPVGVSLSKDITAGEWTVRPAADFTVSLNFGDDAINSSTAFDGIYGPGSNVSYNTEFVDNVSYGAALGISAKNGNLSFGLNAGYTRSSSTDEYSVGANARFAF